MFESKPMAGSVPQTGPEIGPGIEAEIEPELGEERAWTYRC
jgi:hypothetical protein